VADVSGDAKPPLVFRAVRIASLSTRLGQRHLAVAGERSGRWIEAQINGLPSTIDFVIVAMHHPPVADIQQHIEVSHNPRPNEIALRDYLTKLPRHPMQLSW